MPSLAIPTAFDSLEQVYVTPLCPVDKIALTPQLKVS